MSELSEGLGAALEQVPDEWGRWPRARSAAAFHTLNEGMSRGFIQCRMEGAQRQYRRTDLGRKALEKQP